MIYNKLYNIFSFVYGKVYERYKFKYYENVFDHHTFLIQFIKILRLNYVTNSLEFPVQKLLTQHTLRIFDEEITPELFCELILEFVFELDKQSFVVFDFKKFSILFPENLKQDLIELMFCSFDLMLFGSGYQDYESFIVNDFFTQNEFDILI